MPDNQSKPLGLKDLAKMHTDGQYDQMATLFINTLVRYIKRQILTIDKKILKDIDLFLLNYFYYLTLEDFQIHDQGLQKALIKYSTTTVNLAAISSFGTTDAFIKLIQARGDSAFKIFALYSARNSHQIPYPELFQLDSELASYWYNASSQLFGTTLVNPLLLPRCSNHFQSIDNLPYKLVESGHNNYMFSTYTDLTSDRKIKRVINQLHQDHFHNQWDLAPINSPEKKKVAVITLHWQIRHSVYRTQAGFIRSLRKKYHLTLVRMVASPNDDCDMFDNVITIFKAPTDDLLNREIIKKLQQENFSLIYYPSIGMDAWSIQLANIALAPLQCCGVGHPVSTFGSKINFFFSGAAVEDKNSLAINYSENIVLLPYFGLTYESIDFEREAEQTNSSGIVISCSWSRQKINLHNLTLLRSILDRSSNETLVKIFPGNVYHCAFPSFKKDIAAILGEHRMVLYPNVKYPQYMNLLKDSDLCLESYHFGSSNVMCEYLVAGKPVVAYEGSRYYNRIGSAILRRAGLHELICREDESYLNLAVRLIDDSDYRNSITTRIGAMNINKKLAEKQDDIYFSVVIDYLMANAEALLACPDQQVIEIKEDKSIHTSSIASCH